MKKQNNWEKNPIGEGKALKSLTLRRKLMKRIISITLCMAMVFSMGAATSCVTAEKPTLFQTEGEITPMSFVRNFSEYIDSVNMKQIFSDFNAHSHDDTVEVYLSDDSSATAEAVYFVVDYAGQHTSHVLYEGGSFKIDVGPGEQFAIRARYLMEGSGEAGTISGTISLQEN